MGTSKIVAFKTGNVFMKLRLPDVKLFGTRILLHVTSASISDDLQTEMISLKMPVCINGLFKSFLHGIYNISLTLVSMEFSSLEIRKDTLPIFSQYS